MSDYEVPAVPLTSEEARTVELPSRLHPIKRLAQLAAYGSSFSTRHVGMSILPQFLTRGDLVSHAEAHEEARRMMNIAYGFDPESQPSENFE